MCAASFAASTPETSIALAHWAPYRSAANNSRCQVPFQSLPSPLASPTFGIPPDRDECDAETIGLEQVEPGRVGVDRPVGIDDRAIERLPFEPFGLFKATLEGPPVGRGRDHDRRRRFGPLFSGRRPGLL